MDTWQSRQRVGMGREWGGRAGGGAQAEGIPLTRRLISLIF